MKSIRTFDVDLIERPEDLIGELLENIAFAELPTELLGNLIARTAALTELAAVSLEGSGHRAECEVLWTAHAMLDMAHGVLQASRRGQRQQAVGGKPPHPWLGGRILDWLDHHDAGASQSMRASSPGRVH